MYSRPTSFFVIIVRKIIPSAGDEAAEQSSSTCVGMIDSDEDAEKL